MPNAPEKWCLGNDFQGIEQEYQDTPPEIWRMYTFQL